MCFPESCRDSKRRRKKGHPRWISMMYQQKQDTLWCHTASKITQKDCQMAGSRIELDPILISWQLPWMLVAETMEIPPKGKNSPQKTRDFIFGSAALTFSNLIGALFGGDLFLSRSGSSFFLGCPQKKYSTMCNLVLIKISRDFCHLKRGEIPVIVFVLELVFSEFSSGGFHQAIA